MAEAIQAVREAYVQLSAGQAVVPLRTPVPVDKHEGVTLFMPAYLTASDALGAKIVSVFPGNLERGLPTIHAVVIVVDAETGRPMALMDGTYLTALRTGAASGVATDLLARSDARVAAIFGAGAQARTQLEAVCTVRPIQTVWVFDPVPGAAAAYVAEMRMRSRPIPRGLRVAESPAQAVSQADVICTATTVAGAGVRRRRPEARRPHQRHRLLHAPDAGGAGRHRGAGQGGGRFAHGQPGRGRGSG